ncbi:MAG: Hsp20/alpha crystallin family protein [Anaerolineae bacterium]|nr:Hsp20/alpha crystallin family protein [Anaerolineae bacterium]
MSNLTRWTPFRDLLSMRHEMDRLFDQVFTTYPMERGDSMQAPLVDLLQTDSDIVVKATLPGIDADDLDIQIIGDVLTIKAEIKEEKEEENATYHLREQSYKAFSRSISLPAPTQADKAKAEIKNGLLTLTIPKAEEAKPKVITVKAK